jgi:2-keto-4-pentenoate hydratase/2-oxohepta-3-ene-1,7-dioic acid hydratase in catechol pathway
MIWCRFESTHGPSYGLVEGGVVTEVNGPQWGDHEITAIKHPLESVKLLVPVVPNTFYAGGLNYERHAIEASKKYGVKEPKLPTAAVIGYRATARSLPMMRRWRRYRGTPTTTGN